MDGIPFSTKYVKGRTPHEITFATVANDMRVSLSKIKNRVHGKKKESTAPKSISRAQDADPEWFTADVGDGRMNLLQLMQEIAELVDDIASAPSAKKASKSKAEKTSGGDGGDVVPHDIPSEIAHNIAQDLRPNEVHPIIQTGQFDKLENTTTFGGADLVSVSPVPPVQPVIPANAVDPAPSIAPAPVAAPLVAPQPPPVAPQPQPQLVAQPAQTQQGGMAPVAPDDIEGGYRVITIG